MAPKKKQRIRPTKLYRCYDADSLLKAYQKVQESGWSVNFASKKYSVPLTTLRDRVDGRINIDTKQGAPTFFSMQEEKDLFNHVKLLADMGYGYGRKELAILAGDMAFYLKRKKSPIPMSKNWVSGFIRRWKDLKLIKPRTLSIDRAKYFSEETVTKYYSELHKMMDKYNLFDKPELIYNIDATGISPEHKPHRVIGIKGVTTQAITSNRSTTATVIAAANALGTSLPPFFIFKGVMLLPALLDGALPGTAATMSATGWSNSVIFQQYLEQHFLKYSQRSLDPDQPLLILYDGHASHVCVPVIEWARSKGIILFLLPPHTSHYLQPLDISCFGPFKEKYYAECQLYMKQNPGCQILRQDMCRIACKAYSKGLSNTNVISAFRKVGIYPLNGNIVTPDKFAPSKAVNPVQTIIEDSDETIPATGSVEDFLKEKEPQPMNSSTTKKKGNRLKLGGQAITEDECFNIIKEKEKETQKKPCKVVNPSKPTKKITKENNKVNEKPTKTNTCKGKQGNKSVKTEKAKVTPCTTNIDSPQPGPSAYNIVNSSCSSDDDDDVGDPNDLCCVCKKNSPPAMRNLPYIYFVNWGKCDTCGHWTHPKFCSAIRVVRRGDNFLCPHCE